MLVLFCFSNQQNHGNAASDLYFKADTKSPSSGYLHGPILHSNQAVISANTAGIESEAAHVPASDRETGRRCKDGYRLTPVMPRQSSRNKQIVEFNSRDGGSASSSPSTVNSFQTPVISDTSKHSDLSVEICRLLPGGQIMTEHQRDVSLANDSSSLSCVQRSGQLAHCSSETNLVSASGSLPRGNRSNHADERQVIGKAETPPSVEYAQQLRRRSHSADNLSRRHKQKADSAAWSAVDIDVGAHTESTVIDRAQQLDVQQQQMKQGSTGNKSVDNLPASFTTTRLRPFRQQMNSVVVSFFALNISNMLHSTNNSSDSSLAVCIIDCQVINH